MNIDISQMSFSRRGSYLAISAMASEIAGARPVLWIRFVRDILRTGRMLRIETLRNVVVCPHAWQAGPEPKSGFTTRLVLQAGGES